MNPSFSLRTLERLSSESPFTVTPSSVYSPPSNSSSRPAMLRKVVLPEPDGPVTVTNSPFFTSMSKPRSACVSIMWVRYTLVRSFICSMTFLSVSVDFYPRRVLELLRARDDDVVSDFHALDHLDGTDTRAAHANGLPDRESVLHHVGELAAVRLDERPARQEQHVRPLVDQQARGHALALPQARRLRAFEAHAGEHLVADHLGRDRDELPRGFDVAGGDLGFHAHAQVLHVGLGNLELHLEAREVHERHERRIGRDDGAVDDGEAAHQPVHGRANVELVHPAARLVQRELLARELLAPRAQLQVDVVGLEPGGFGGVLATDLRGLQVVARLLEVV